MPERITVKVPGVRKNCLQNNPRDHFLINIDHYHRSSSEDDKVAMAVDNCCVFNETGAVDLYSQGIAERCQLTLNSFLTSQPTSPM